MTTKSDLLALIASEITTNGERTITGAQLNDILTKIVNSYADAMPYKKYIAYVSQTGTADPFVSVVVNELGVTLAWTRAAAGEYHITKGGGGSFDPTRTMIIVADQQPHKFNILTPGSGPIIIYTVDSGGTLTDNYLKDWSGVAIPIEIRIFT